MQNKEGEDIPLQEKCREYAKRLLMPLCSGRLQKILHKLLNMIILFDSGYVMFEGLNTGGLCVGNFSLYVYMTWAFNIMPYF